jgi:uncharacterized delta-60 repeat protein
MSIHKIILCALMALVTMAMSANGAPADLDVTFNGTGVATLEIGSGNAFGRTVATQQDGKILVGGYSSNGSNFDFTVIRFNQDGSLDNTFGTNGIVVTPVGTGDEYGLCIAIQADGKILLAGYSGNSGNEDIALVRYNVNGTLDTSFDSDGKVLTPIGAGTDAAWSLTIQQDGKILLGGWSNDGSQDNFALVRYNTDGSLDANFDGDGKVVTPVGRGGSSGRGVAVQSDGKIVLAGIASNGGNADFAVVRYNNNGSLDTGFANNGKAITAVGNSTDYAYSVAIQADGKIVVAGYSYSGSNADFAIVRYNPNGTIDTGFDGDGKVIASIGSGNDYALKVAVQTDGKLVVVGSAAIGSSSDIAVVRLNPDGSFDSTFSDDGKLTTLVSPTSDASWDVVVEPNGRILVAGWSQIGARYDFTLLRYVGATALESWRYNHFGSTVNVGSAASASDPDHDGLPNLIEFAFGLDPTLGGSCMLPLPQRIGNNFSVGFSEPIGISGVRYGAEWSASLLPGSWTPITDTGVPSQHQFTVPVGSQNQLFLRFTILEQP